MRLLIIGDIVGRAGKHACSQVIPKLVNEREITCVIANAENAAAGSGLTPQMFAKLRHYGVDVCTMGDHIYRRREVLPLLTSSDRSRICPLSYLTKYIPKGLAPRIVWLSLIYLRLFSHF